MKFKNNRANNVRPYNVEKLTLFGDPDEIFVNNKVAKK